MLRDSRHSPSIFPTEFMRNPGQQRVTTGIGGLWLPPPAIDKLTGESSCFHCLTEPEAPVLDLRLLRQLQRFATCLRTHSADPASDSNHELGEDLPKRRSCKSGNATGRVRRTPTERGSPRLPKQDI